MSKGNDISPTPTFFLPDRGKSPPRLHKAHIEARMTSLGITLKPSLPLKPTQPNSIAVGPMKPLQGPTSVGKPRRPYRPRHRGVGWKSFRAATLNRSRQGFPNPNPSWSLISTRVPHNIENGRVLKVWKPAPLWRWLSEIFP